MNDEVRALIAERAPEQMIKKAGRRSGMRTLFEDGVEKASQGLTTLDEVLRTVSMDEADEAPRRAQLAAVLAAQILAASPAPAAPHGTQPSAAAALAAAGAAAVSDDGRRPQVLVVEDSPTVSSVVSIFRARGLRRAAGRRRRIGLETARREHPTSSSAT